MSPDDPRHGTPAGHHAGCRETCCREARNRYERNARKRRQLGRRALVDATGTRRRLQALMRLGWPGRILAERAGIARGQSGVDTLIRETRQVTRQRAEAIAAMYDELCMTLGPSEVTRRRAEAKGWPPPLAWTNIDDPNETPAGHKETHARKEGVDFVVVDRILSGERGLRTTREERVEILRRWVARGGSERSLCMAMGWREGRYTTREEAS